MQYNNQNSCTYGSIILSYICFNLKDIIEDFIKICIAFLLYTYVVYGSNGAFIG